MSTRSYGMMGKSYKSTSEAFKDADYANAIEMPKASNTGSFWAFMVALMFVSMFGYGFWQTISRF